MRATTELETVDVNAERESTYHKNLMDWVTGYGSYPDAATLLSQYDMEKVQRLHR